MYPSVYKHRSLTFVRVCFCVRGVAILMCIHDFLKHSWWYIPESVIKAHKEAYPECDGRVHRCRCVPCSTTDKWRLNSSPCKLFSYTKKYVCGKCQIIYGGWNYMRVGTFVWSAGKEAEIERKKYCDPGTGIWRKPPTKKWVKAATKRPKLDDHAQQS